MLTLYDAPRCPYCARVRIMLAEKGIPYDPVEIDLDDRPAWIYDKNATGRVPVIEEGDWVLPESAVILEYLEERFPEPALLPADPADRAAVRLRIFRFDDALGDAYYAFRRGEADGAARLEHCLGFLERALGRWTHDFGLADVAYLPWLIRLRDLLDVDLSPYPTVLERLDRAAERPSVAAELDVVAALP
ncbi:MAG TPA: glutathione S-transferase family protein [Gaiellaceae bacterium]